VVTDPIVTVAAAATPLHDLDRWARGNGLVIVLVVTGAVLLSRFVAWWSGRITDRIDRNVRSSDAIVRSESAKHRHAVAQVVSWAVVVLIYCLAAVVVIQRLGFPLTGIVAPATVLGVALGFGAQRIVQDLLAGFFVIIERQYGFGDVVRINATGVGIPVTGTVEDVTLRVTRVRTLDGEVVTTSNGQIAQVTNLSRDWARAVIDVPVPVSVDVNRVSEVLKQVGVDAFADAGLHPLLLDAPTVMGVESLDVDHFNVRVVARTLPGKQFDVGRALRSRITIAFAREGVSVHVAGVDTTEPTGATP
jgi:small conductance mechanosensitive channel